MTEEEIAEAVAFMRSTFAPGIKALPLTEPTRKADPRVPVRVPDAVWEELEGRAHEKDLISDSVPWTRRWNPKFNLLGLVGEWVFCSLVGQQMKYGFGDGGFDYGDVDVKATRHYKGPRLLRLATDKFRAERYALVAVDEDRRLGRYVGFATREEFQSAPVKEYGYGPTRTLYEAQLNHDLPTL